MDAARANDPNVAEPAVTQQITADLDRDDVEVRESMKRPHQTPTATSGVKPPNAETRRAIDELDQGNGERCLDVAALFNDLGL